MQKENFAHFNRAQKSELLDRIRFCETQTEAARALLAKASAENFDPAFWADALEFAEAEEARARRNFANWQRRDIETARRNFEFERALSPATMRAIERTPEATR